MKPLRLTASSSVAAVAPTSRSRGLRFPGMTTVGSGCILSLDVGEYMDLDSGDGKNTRSRSRYPSMNVVLKAETQTT